MKGRPSILNEELITIIVEHTLKGISIDSICALSGIGRQTYYDWMTRGKEDIEVGLQADESLFVLFVQSIGVAEAEVEKKMLEQAVGTDPIGARWYLARKMRNDYGDRQEIDITGNIEIEILWPEDED